jgi:hypothetical protein
LALPPDSSETFLREVDENLRRDQLQDFIKTYGKWLIAALVLFLAATGGWIYWDNRQKEQSAAQSEELHGAFTSIAQGQNDVAERKLTGLEDSRNDVVRASAVMAEAALALDKNDRAKALAAFKKVAADDDYPQPYRDIATIRATSLEFDTIKPEEVIARLQPMAQAGNPFFGSAGEMTALALLKQGKKAEAGKMFAAVAADKQVPQSIRSRAAQIAGTLGTDASASMPSLDKQD